MIEETSVSQPPIVVVIWGKPFAGKDTVAKALHAATPFLFRDTQSWIDWFAADVKLFASKIYGLDYDRLLYDPEYKALHRSKLQGLGNHVRSNDPIAWAHSVYERVTLRSGSCPEKLRKVHYLADWRYPDEGKYQAEKGLSVRSIEVVCDEKVRAARMGSDAYQATLELEKDVSETSLDSRYSQFVIENSDGLDYVWNRAYEILPEVLSAPTASCFLR